MDVKNSLTVRRDDVRALKTFVVDYPECEPLLLYRGAESVVVNGVRCMPVNDFLVGLRPDGALTDTPGARHERE